MPASSTRRAQTRHRRAWIASTAVVLALVVGAGLLVWSWVSRTKLVLSPTCTATAGSFSGSLDPDQSGNAALISAIAVKRGLPARAATIAIATAMQESKLRNINYGDRDSLGLFQQRPSQGWGTKEQILDPHYATNKFYDSLVKVSGYQTMSVTQAAQRVQRSAFPDAYAFHESTARAFAADIYGQEKAALRCELDGVATVGSTRTDDQGYTERARALLNAANAEFGAVQAKPADDGSTVTVTFANDDAGHARAWGFAHWAVASAERLSVTSVAAADNTWHRKDAKSAWVRDEGSGGASTVVVKLP